MVRTWVPACRRRRRTSRQAEDAAGTRARAVGCGRRRRRRRRQKLAAARSAAAASAAGSTSRAYACVRDVPTLTDWIAEAREAGVARLRHLETTSLDPMQADLLGFSLATAAGPRRLCAARPQDRQRRSARRRAGGRPDRHPRCARAAEAAARRSVPSSSSTQNVKYDLVVIARHGIDLSPFDDTMLISYVLDAGINVEPRHGRAGRALARPQADPHQGCRRLAAAI